MCLRMAFGSNSVVIFKFLSETSCCSCWRYVLYAFRNRLDREGAEHSRKDMPVHRRTGSKSSGE